MNITDIDELNDDKLKQLILFYQNKCSKLELELLKEQMNYSVISKLFVDLQKKYSELTEVGEVDVKPAKPKTKTEK
jgi:hypothetical protein